jgi:hypothetical protein
VDLNQREYKSGSKNSPDPVIYDHARFKIQNSCDDFNFATGKSFTASALAVQDHGGVYSPKYVVKDDLIGKETLGNPATP